MARLTEEMTVITTARIKVLKINNNNNNNNTNNNNNNNNNNKLVGLFGHEFIIALLLFCINKKLCM